MNYYIIKLKDTMTYLKSIKDKNYTYTFKVEEAKKYNKSNAEKNCDSEKFEVVNYEEELYKSRKEKYRLYVETILKTEGDINKEDLISFLQEYEFAGDGSGKYTSYLLLKEEYPKSKLIDEIVRVGEIIKHRTTVIWHEAMVDLSKDKEFNDGVFNKVIITEDNIKEYNEAKKFLKRMSEEFPCDYNADKQYELLDTEFRKKYITREIYKEYFELYNDEEFEEESEEHSV